MKFEHATFDFHGVFYAAARDEQFWKELLGSMEKKSEAQNLKELGF